MLLASVIKLTGALSKKRFLLRWAKSASCTSRCISAVLAPDSTSTLVSSRYLATASICALIKFQAIVLLAFLTPFLNLPSYIIFL